MFKSQKRKNAFFVLTPKGKNPLQLRLVSDRLTCFGLHIIMIGQRDMSTGHLEVLLQRAIMVLLAVAVGAITQEMDHSSA